jgi:hypothetical protein
MPLTQSEITNLQNDGVFKNNEKMARLNSVLNSPQNRILQNITYNDIKNDTERQMNITGYTKLIQNLTDNEKNNIAEKVIKNYEAMIPTNWVGTPGNESLLEELEELEGGRRKSRRTKRTKRTKRSRSGTKKNRKGSKRRRR